MYHLKYDICACIYKPSPHKWGLYSDYSIATKTQPQKRDETLTTFVMIGFVRKRRHGNAFERQIRCIPE